MTAAEPRLTVALTFDHDAISSEVDRGDGPVLRSRGEFGPRVGAPRVLALLEREAIPSTWFVPGHTLVTFPDSVEAILAGGHELGCHGWAHEDLTAVDPDTERAIMERSVAAIGRAAGRPPRGFRAPYWALSERTLGIAAELGLAYDSSMMADDVHPYRIREGDVHDAQAGSRFGRPGPLVEVPVSWALDDWPHFEPGAKGVGPMSAASKVEEIWTARAPLRLGARARRRPDDHDASRGDRPGPSTAHARAVHRDGPFARRCRLRPARPRRGTLGRGRTRADLRLTVGSTGWTLSRLSGDRPTADLWRRCRRSGPWADRTDGRPAGGRSARPPAGAVRRGSPDPGRRRARAGS